MKRALDNSSNNGVKAAAKSKFSKVLLLTVALPVIMCRFLQFPALMPVDSGQESAAVPSTGTSKEVLKKNHGSWHSRELWPPGEC